MVAISTPSPCGDLRGSGKAPLSEGDSFRPDSALWLNTFYFNKQASTGGYPGLYIVKIFSQP
jgi:hypothetical protein